jgi:hypothetical protein
MAAGMLPPWTQPAWGTAAHAYFSKFLVCPFIFQKSKKKYKKSEDYIPL